MKTRPNGSAAHFPLTVLVLAACLPVATAFSAESWSPGPGWKLEWADEFEGWSIDPESWTQDLGAGGWGNNELQTYTSANAFVENGALVIEARKNSDSSYTSSRLKTQGRQSWKYGKIAARIRLPYGQGIWPAFWMLGENISSIGWPKCGEIDIMEMIGGGEGRDDTHYGTLHWDANNAHASHSSGARALPNPQFLHQDYHVFEIEWSRSEVIWKRDAVEFFRTSVDPNLYPTMEEFHRPFFIVLNTAVGGNWPGSPDATTVFPQRMLVDWVRVYSQDSLAPSLTITPASQTLPVGGNATFAVTATGTGPFNYQWRKAGHNLPLETGATLTLTNLSAADAASYDVVVTNNAGTFSSAAALLGVSATGRVTGAAEQRADHVRHPNGYYYDQVLLTGAAAAVTADYAADEITRTSFIDFDGDIVQVEFSGPGTLSLVLKEATAPAAAEKYNQPDVLYVKGHAGIIITGADERTNVSVFTVGRATAWDKTGGYDILMLPDPGTNNPADNGSPLFSGHASTVYGGTADLAFIAIMSPSGKFGGVRTANANYFAAKGLTGVYAPGVQFTGPVYIGDITAFDSAKPVIVLGSVSDARITGGSLAQANAAPVQASGITQLTFTDGRDSHGRPVPAQDNRGLLMDNGADVTAQIVVNP